MSGCPAGAACQGYLMQHWGDRRPGPAGGATLDAGGDVAGGDLVPGKRGRDGEPKTGLSVGEVVLQLPVLGLLALLMWWYRSWPRRVPNLARLTRTAGFGRLQSASAAWLEDSFALIERAAPWLDRAGQWTCDRCHTSWGPGSGLTWFKFPRDPPSAGCGREVTVVYGFDGDLPGRLAGLAEALAAAGWGEMGHGGAWVPLRDLSRREAVR
jgi:hypothetical protein